MNSNDLVTKSEEEKEATALTIWRQPETLQLISELFNS
jgi:hypothetical protein